MSVSERDAAGSQPGAAPPERDRRAGASRPTLAPAAGPGAAPGLVAAAGLAACSPATCGCPRRSPANSDGASNALQAWDMLHGNLLLHGWWLSDVSFYTTELPEYMLVELGRIGLNADVVHVGAALTYTLLVAARGAAGQGQGDRRARPGCGC